LKCVNILEKSKFEAQQKMYELVRRQQLPPGIINNVIKAEEMRAQDLFFVETGIEECDIEPNLERLDMMKDPEFLAIINEYSQKSQSYLSTKKGETEAMVQKAAALK
jgi:hypothetical protein